VKPNSVTQSFYGAWDLDLPPAQNGTHTVGRVWVGKGQEVTAQIAAIDKAGWEVSGSLEVKLTAPRGNQFASGTTDTNQKPSPVIHGIATETGWHTITFTGHGLPPAGCGSSGWDLSGRPGPLPKEE
jgi:hypothetical protein